jgi:hypothetical protein
MSASLSAGKPPNHKTGRTDKRKSFSSFQHLVQRVGDKVVDDGVESDRVDATKLKTDRIEVRQS